MEIAVESTRDGMYSKSFKYPVEGGERCRENVRRNLLADLGIKLVEEIADTDQHYTIKVDTTDEEDLVSQYVGYDFNRCRRFTASISVCPVKYRRMEMMKFDERQDYWKLPRSEPDCPSLWKRFWQWASEPIVYDGPMPSPRPVATAQEPIDRDPADDEFWAEQDRAAFVSFQGPQSYPRR